MTNFYLLEGENKKVIMDERILRCILLYRNMHSIQFMSEINYVHTSVHLGADRKLYSVLVLNEWGRAFLYNHPVNPVIYIKYKKALHEMVKGKNENSQEELKDSFKAVLRYEGFDRISKYKDKPKQSSKEDEETQILVKK